MPRVPTYGGDRVATRPIAPNRRPTPTADVYGAQLGGEIAQTGLRAGAEIARIVEEQKRRADELALVTGKRQFNDLYRQEALSTDRGQNTDGTPGAKGILTMQGAEPHKQLEANQTRWDEQADMIIGGASNPRQRALLEALRDEERARYQDQALRHASNEYTKYETGEVEATLKSTIDTAGAAAGREGWEETVANQLQTLDTLIDAKGEKIGLLGPEEKARAKAEGRSQIHLSVINRFLDLGDDIAAQTYWDTVSTPTAANPQGEILESQAGPTRNKLQVNGTDGRGDRNARAAWEKLGPKTPGDTVKNYDLQQYAHELATVNGKFDPKTYARSLDYLQSMSIAWSAQAKGGEEATKGVLLKAIAEGVPVAELRQLPAFRDASLEQQAVTLEAAKDRDRRKILDLRSDHEWQRNLRREPLEDLALEEQRRSYYGAPTYLNLVLHPEQLAAMDDNAIEALSTTLSREQMGSVKRERQTAIQNVNGSGFATIDPETFRSVLSTNGLPFVTKTPGQMLDVEKRAIAAVHMAAEQEIAKQQTALARGTGVKVIFTTEQQEKVIKQILDRKVLLPGAMWGSTEVIAATVQQDQFGKAYVPIGRMKETSPDSLAYLREAIRRAPEKAGTSPTRTLADAEIDARYGGAMERAYAQMLLGVPPEAWAQTLYDGIGKYVPPPAPRRPFVGPTLPRSGPTARPRPSTMPSRATPQP